MSLAFGGLDTTPTAAPAAIRVQGARLEVRAGPSAGRVARVDSPVFVIGSGEAADLRLDDPAVSREHVRLSASVDGIVLRDGASKNGTWIGGARVRDAVLTTDANLTLGRSRIALCIEAAPIRLPLSANDTFGEAQGVSTAMRHLFAVLERIAPADVTVLLEGESGVGKEVLARAIHARSSRAHGPFVAVDCGAIPPGLVETELFGHARGAFTGAQADRVGLFEQANGGTLFLDEIGELPVELQPKLLRALEQREVRPVGSRAEPRRVDVRVVAATNRRLAEASARGEFRTDLFYRLAVARVCVPALRDRPEDIVPLARGFLRRSTRDPRAELPPDLAAMFVGYAWPGNVRELRNAVERYVVLGSMDARALLESGEVRIATSRDDLSHLPYDQARQIALDRFEGSYAPRVLERAGGVVVRAAELAHMGRASFYRMLDRVRAASKG